MGHRRLELSSAALRAARRVKRFVELALSHPALGRLVGALLRDDIRIRGCRIDTSGDVVAPAAKAALFFGLYEKSEIRFVRRHLARDLDVVELGASLGVVSSHIAQHLAPQRRLVCVEANPRLLERARANVLRNAPGASVAFVHGAIDYSRGGGDTAAFSLSEGNLSSRLASPTTVGTVVSVPRVTLTGVLREHGLTEYALVSDIEGAEAALLLADRDALQGCRALVIELHDAEVEGQRVGVEDSIRTIESLGFILRDRSGIGRAGPVCAFVRPGDPQRESA